ncbi:MAG: insulinase family protein [Chlorobiota bacterium]|nr:MAG: insulinase family protein [Chlorobiota bacterium]
MKIRKLFFVIIVVFLYPLNQYSQQLDINKPPVPETNSNYIYPSYVEYNLRNGLKVFFIKTDKPLATINVMVNGGKLSEELVGTSEVLVNLILLGSKNNSSTKFQNEIDFNAIDLKAQVTDDAFIFNAKSLNRNFRKLLSLVSESISKPAFNIKIFEEYKKYYSSLLITNTADADYLSKIGTNKLLFGETNLGNILSPELIDYMQIDDVNKLYEENFSSKNSSIAITGNFNKDQLLKDLEATFGNWKVGEKVLYDRPSFPEFKGGEILIIDKPNSVQSTIKAIGSGFKFDDSLRIKSILLNNIIGGVSLNSRLSKNLREKNGYTYTPTSEFSTNRFTSNFITNAEVSNIHTADCIKEMLFEFNKIQFDSLSKEELSRFINSTIGNFYITLKKPEEYISLLQSSFFYNIPKEFYANYIDIIKSITSNDIIQVARDIFRMNAVSFVVVGKSSEIIPQLENITQKISVYDKNLLPIKVGPRSESNSIARDIWFKMLDSLGGVDKLHRIKSLKTSGNLIYSSNMMSHPLKGEYVKIQTIPFKQYELIDLKLFRIESFLNENGGFKGEVGNITPLTNGESNISKTIEQIIPEAYLLNNDAQLEFIGKVKVGKNKENFIIDLNYPRIDIVIRYVIDSETFLPISKTINDSIKTKFDDWKYLPILGIKLPHSIEINQSKLVKMNIFDIRYEANIDLDERIFYPK